MLGLQRATGNQAVLRLLRSGALQTKSEISVPGDAFEQEADRVAREVVSRPASPPPLRRRPEPIPEAGQEPSPSGGPPAARDALRSPGQPLDPEARASMEERFGRDFSQVRIHTGPSSEAAAETIHAKAFTIGSDVVFGRGHYDPHGGQELLAHELTHVAQQGRAGPLPSPLGRPQISPASGAAGVLRKAEAELDYAALAVKIRKAIVGLGTDEEAVYAALRQLGRDANKIARLEALYLSQFGDSLEDDIRGDFSGSELDEALVLISSTDLQLAARRVRTAVEGLGTDEDAIYKAFDTLGHDPLKTRQLKEIYQDLYHEDLVARIEDEMSGDELAFALHLLRQPTATQSGVVARGEKTAAEMEKNNQKMQWTPSFPGSGTDFEKWASAPSQGATPKIGPQTVMNCWEAVLLLAFQQGAISWAWIHKQYPIPPYQKDSKEWNDWIQKWNADLARTLSGGMQIPYGPKDSPPRIPLRGDIVLFDGVDHVALATGRRDGQGRTVVLSFWPPSEKNNSLTPRTGSLVETTIEELEEFVIKIGKDRQKSAEDHEVTFARPPW
jgi:hypothetical protein